MLFSSYGPSAYIGDIKINKEKNKKNVIINPDINTIILFIKLKLKILFKFTFIYF